VVGRLDPIKGHRSFFKVFGEMLKIWPQDKPAPWLEIIGQPANISIETLRSFAQENHLREGHDWALCAERVADLPQRLRATHLGIVPSLGSEVICRVAEEFLLSGCPIFVSEVGSLPECLFADLAGSSFSEAPAEVVASYLQRQLWSAYTEGEAQRLLRSEEAAKRFSLERMARDLDESLSRFL
jgi:glycosyltransferase involved in cell wall biosynthesis